MKTLLWSITNFHGSAQQAQAQAQAPNPKGFREGELRRASGFVANGVDFLAIPALERDDWVELGVPIGHRAHIIKEHKSLHPEMW